MLTMAILAIIGAFIFGFVLCGIFAVGAAADRFDRAKPDDGHDSLEVALLRAALAPRLVRHPDTHPSVSSNSTRLRRPRSTSLARRDGPVTSPRGTRRRPPSQA